MQVPSSCFKPFCICISIRLVILPSPYMRSNWLEALVDSDWKLGINSPQTETSLQVSDSP